jgi:hypothetical protein
MAIWNTLRPFEIFYENFVHFVLHNLVHFSGFGIVQQEKSGNPADDNEWKKEQIFTL